MSDLTKLEAELAQGFPDPWWPQDDPRVRTQRLPERCCHGHDAAEHGGWRWVVRNKGGCLYRYWAWYCRECKRDSNRGVVHLPTAADHGVIELTERSA